MPVIFIKRPSRHRFIPPLMLCAAALLSGCAAGVGFSIPIFPGVSLGVGMNSGGDVNLGLGTGIGPVGVGVGVNQRGQVSTGAGVGVSTGVGGGGARVGAGVGAGTVIYDPNAAPVNPPPRH
jgi:hypothetical protein